MDDIFVDGEKLMAAMEKKGFTVSTLALRVRMSEQMLQEIIDGQRAISFLDMTRLAGLLGVGSTELMKQ
ncbi:MAG: helix-turn-helix transcriptional regulator [Lachnospiraceae bacterium]|nr:helix-turn-helix transcriptional regulator [Oribacterium sp.]MEE3461946.1 helix-turn-helix transcriptional regulator [Lachnospiraceae bacterium]